MKQFSWMLSSLILIQSALTCSWLDKWSLQPTFQSTYNYIKSIDPKYIAIGSTLFGGLLLSYLYNKKKVTPIFTHAQLLAKNILAKDRKYFTRRVENLLNDTETVWNNPLIKNVILEKERTLHDDKKISFTYLNKSYEMLIQIVKADGKGYVKLLLVELNTNTRSSAFWQEEEDTWTFL